MKVLMTGATGLLGKEIGKKLNVLGHRVTIITRNKARAQLQCPFPCEIIEGDLEKEPLRDRALQNIEAVIHLAGENVAEGRWTESKKRRIYNSRVLGTKNLLESLNSASLKAFVSTSAVGFYGDRGEEILTEDTKPGTGFLADVCRDWEKNIEVAAGKNSFPSCRFVIFRMSVILSPYGGGLAKMLPLFRSGLGARIGNGKQWMPWVHIEDAAQTYLAALTQSEFSGTYNLCAPEQVTNQKFSETLATAVNKSLFFPVPKSALRTAFGEMAHAFWSSQRTSCEKLAKVAPTFRFPDLRGAFADLLQPFQGGDEVLHREQFFPSSPETVFQFFSDAKNLLRITPDFVNMRVKKMSTPQITSGSLIDYRLRIHGLPMRWRTEILTFDPPKGFVDIQVHGPYSKWHHTHEFVPLAGGTLMVDQVLYRVPMGFIGRGVGGLLVAKELNQIFQFRREACASVDFAGGAIVS